MFYPSVKILKVSTFNGNEVSFKGLIIQMRNENDIPVGRMRLTQNLQRADFDNSFKFLQCPTVDGTLKDNTITHINNDDKTITASQGPIFMWTPVTNDGIWDDILGYGPIFAQ